MNNLSTKTTLSTQTIGIKILKYLLLFLVSVFFLSSPILHKFFPDKISPVYKEAKAKYRSGELSKEAYEPIRKANTYFGYSTQMRLMYAIGQPLFMFFMSLVLFYTTFKILDKNTKYILRTISFISTFVSFYFLLWAFWYRADLPVETYYLAIGIISIAVAVMVYYIFKLMLYVKKKKETRMEALESFMDNGLKLIDKLKPTA